jgi:aldehyde dehydrogenase (NAD+)/betaine-aldehyde dehydrogenase
MFDQTRLSDATKGLISGARSLQDEGWLFVTGSGAVDVVEPGTGRVVGAVPSSTPADVTAAVLAARRAFDDSEWSRLSPADRKRLLRRLAEAVDRHSESFAELAVLEVGAPITTGRGLHAAVPVQYLHWWADQAIAGPPGGYEESLGLASDCGPGADRSVMAMSLLYREPVGVVAAIVPYNAPLLIAAFKVGGALAAGCTCVLLPSIRTPLFALALLNCCREAGLPPGVLTAVIGGEEIGRTLTTADGVDMVSFTGSVAVGKQVGAQASGRLKKVVLELGGKSPNILLPGTNVQHVVAPSSMRYLRNAGQGCGATTRTIVPRALYDEYADAAGAFFESLVIGDPWDPDTELGPLIRAEHRDRVEGFVERAVAQGAVVAAGGSRPDLAEGFFMNPALVGRVSPGSEIVQEELFGPVGVLLPYDTVEEALALANDSRFGLNANIWGPTDDAMRVARRLRSGTVTINGGGVERPEAPWAGYGDSGIGSDRGFEGFREYFIPKHIQFPLSPIGR